MSFETDIPKHIEVCNKKITTTVGLLPGVAVIDLKTLIVQFKSLKILTREKE